MKRVKLLVLGLLLMTAISSCAQKLSLRQPRSEIVQINLVYSPFNEYEVIYMLEEDEIVPFLDVLLDTKLHKNLSPHNVGGGLIVQIVYSDGSVELLGSWSVGYWSNGKLEHDGWYYVYEKELYELFSNYVDLTRLPNIWQPGQ
jgi:hypothetical protein